MKAQEKILSGAEGIFNRYGIRSVTMDDIASRLGISKKTIYQSFKDKDHLVTSILKLSLAEKEKEMELISKKSANAVEEILLLMEYLAKIFSTIHPNTFYELEKYYPAAWKLFLNHRDNYILKKVKENLRAGIKQGLYRNEFDIHIMAKLRMVAVESCCSPAVFPPGEFNLSEVQIQCMTHYLYGLCTDKGFNLIQNFKKKNHTRKK